MRNVLARALMIISVMLGAILLAIVWSFVWAFVASWCVVGLTVCLSMAGIMSVSIAWSWWLVLAFWLLGVIVMLLFSGMRVNAHVTNN